MRKHFCKCKHLFKLKSRGKHLGFKLHFLIQNNTYRKIKKNKATAKENTKYNKKKHAYHLEIVYNHQHDDTLSQHSCSITYISVQKLETGICLHSFFHNIQDYMLGTPKWFTNCSCITKTKKIKSSFIIRNGLNYFSILTLLTYTFLGCSIPQVSHNTCSLSSITTKEQ